MKPNERAKQLGTTVTKMAAVWDCSAANLRELFRNSPHKFDVIAAGAKSLHDATTGTVILGGVKFLQIAKKDQPK